MPFFEIVLWMIFVPLGLASVAGLAFVLEGKWLRLPHKTMRVVSALAMMAPGLSLAYTLVWDWSGLAWFGLSLLFLLVSAILMATFAANEEGLTLKDLRGQLGLVLSKVKNADLIIEKNGARGISNEKPHDSNHSTAPVANTPKRKHSFAILRSVRLVVFVEASLSVLFVVLARLIGHASTPLVSLSPYLCALLLLVSGYYAERILSPRASTQDLGEVDDHALYAGFFCYIAGVVLTAILLFSALDTSFSLNTGTFWTSEGLAVAIAGIATTLMFGGQSLLFVTTAQSARQATESDHRPPVLYLRPFARESWIKALRQLFAQKMRNFGILGNVAVILGKAVARRKNEEEVNELFEEMGRIFERAHKRRTLYGRIGLRGIAQSVASGRGAVWDEQLLLAGVFNQIGPYVAIARPNETVHRSDVGAFKRRLLTDEWQGVVIDLITKSSVIVVEVGTSWGLLWEIERVVRLAPARKVLLILPDSETEYQAFLEQGKSVFPVQFPNKYPNTRFVMFDDWWNPFALENRTSWEGDPSFQLSFVEVLRPFLERNGFSVPTVVD